MPDLQKQILAYAGIEQNPVNDYTEDTDWQRTELTNMASSGEAGSGTWIVRVPDGDVPNQVGAGGVGTKFLGSHNVVELTVGSNVLFRGRINANDVSRGPTRGTRPQERSVLLSDYNDDLRGIVVQNWERPEETDVDRVLALKRHWLTGDPRPSTSLNGTAYVVTGSNLITLEAKTYSATTPMEVLQEIAQTTDKEMYVDVDGNLHYHGTDYTGFDSPLRISDDLADLDSVTCVPIEPTSSVEQRDQLTRLFSYYGDEQERFVEVTANAQKTDYWAETFFDDSSVGATAALRTAQAILNARRQEPVGYTVTIGKPGTIPNLAGNPMTGDDIYKIKAGQRIQFKARAARGGITEAGAYAGDTFLTTHIRSVTWTFPTPDAYYARLELEKPRRIRPPGGGRSQPKSTNPKPAPECVPSPGDSLAKFYNANDAGGDDILWDGILANQGGSPGDGAAGTSFYYFKSTAPDKRQESWAASAGSVYRISGYINSASAGQLTFSFHTSAAGTDNPTDVTLTESQHVISPAQPNSGSTWSLFSAGPFTAPTGTNSAALGRTSGVSFDELSIYLVDTASDVVNDPAAVDYDGYPHSSPFYLPSDYVEARLDELADNMPVVIDDLNDVDTTTTPPADGDVLTWVDADEQWEPLAPSAGSSLDVQEDTASIVATAAALDFVGADFDVTDEGSDVAGVGIAAPSAITPTQLAANTDNWNPTGLASTDVIRASTDASRNLTGIAAPSVARAIVLENIGTNDLVLVHNATSTAANRFFLPSDVNLTLPKDSAVLLVYDTSSTRWRVVGGVGTAGSVAASDVTFTPTAPMVETNVQDAIDELLGLIVLPLTATVGGEGVLVFDENDSLIGVEAY